MRKAFPSRLRREERKAKTRYWNLHARIHFKMDLNKPDKIHANQTCRCRPYGAGGMQSWRHRRCPNQIPLRPRQSPLACLLSPPAGCGATITRGGFPGRRHRTGASSFAHPRPSRCSCQQLAPLHVGACQGGASCTSGRHAPTGTQPPARTPCRCSVPEHCPW